ncbi:hypothetical protein Aduo_009307 [Ancylostoma duodenale]
MSIFRRELTFAELGWETEPSSHVSSGRATFSSEAIEENKELLAHLTAVSGLVPLVARPNSYPASEEEMGMIEEKVIMGHLIRDDIVQNQISIHPNGQVTMMVIIGVEDTNKRCTWYSSNKKMYNVDGPSLRIRERKGVPYFFVDLSIVDYGESRELPDDIARLLKSSFICTVLFECSQCTAIVSYSLTEEITHVRSFVA